VGGRNLVKVAAPLSCLVRMLRHRACFLTFMYTSTLLSATSFRICASTSPGADAACLYLGLKSSWVSAPVSGVMAIHRQPPASWLDAGPAAALLSEITCNKRHANGPMEENTNDHQQQNKLLINHRHITIYTVTRKNHPEIQNTC